MICGKVGEPSTEHVIAKWIRKALQIQGPVKEFSGNSYVGTSEALAVVLHGVCVTCNRGWLNYLEQKVRPVLEPMLLGPAPGMSRALDPADQATLATWAVKTSMLLALSEFRYQDHGWIPRSTLAWLRERYASCMPPPGARVWLGGLHTSEVPSSVQAACIYGENKEPVAHCGTFSVGNVLFQVFTCEQKDAVLSSENEIWLEVKGLYVPALLPIAPTSASLHWPPEVVLGVGDLESLAGRLRQGLPLRA